MFNFKNEISRDLDEVLFEFKDTGQYSAHLPLSISVSGIHKAILLGDLDDVKHLIDSGVPVNEKVQYGFTSLHVAVIKNDLVKIEYLLSRDGVELDAKCFKGNTALHMAAGLGWLESVERLVQAGCDVNLPDDKGNSPLHVSVYSPDICHLLIQNGAQIDAVNNWGATILHEAVKCECHEVLSILLYYNADTNIADMYGHTPFMTAMDCCNVEAQRILLEYVDDFNNSKSSTTALRVALESNSPFARDIIERGADVNYADNANVNDGLSAFNVCLINPVDVATFKTVWERLRFNDFKNTIDLLNLFEVIDVAVVPPFLQVIIDSDNFKPAVQFFARRDNYFQFVIKFAEEHFDLEQLTMLTCRLLQFGFRATSHDVYIIFSYFGHCELLNILLYMDNDYELGWEPYMIIPRIKFDIDCDLESIVSEINNISKDEILQLLEYYVCPPLIDALAYFCSDDGVAEILDSLPKVPSLVQLARDAARMQIRKSFNIATTCQFYTTIDHLNIPKCYREILTLRTKMFTIDRNQLECNSD